MLPRIVAAVAVALATSLTLVTGQPALAQPGYPRMAPIGQYLIASRKAEIAMARSAARRVSRVTRLFWCSARMAIKLHSKERTGSFA